MTTNTTERDALLPCPFCGADISARDDDGVLYGKHSYAFTSCVLDGLEISPDEIRAWNTRTANASEASGPTPRVVSQAVLQAAYENRPNGQHGVGTEFVSGWTACLEYLAREIAAPPSDRAAVEGVSGQTLAQIRHQWMESDEGKRCRDGNAGGVYLRNRLECAFLAGARMIDAMYAERARASSPNAAAAVGQEVELHPRTRDLVSRFSVALAGKLAAAERKYGYTDGWADDDWMEECRGKLIEHVAKGDPIDVAAYCAFLWHHGEYTELRLPWPRPPHMRIR
jgi:hypothetical protein